TKTRCTAASWPPWTRCGRHRSRTWASSPSGGPARVRKRREATDMAHAHKHHGAEKVVTGAKMNVSADMNVTPLIDVLLVLLVIFMAALPLTQKGMDINLPAEASAAPEQVTLAQIVLEYTADRRISI